MDCPLAYPIYMRVRVLLFGVLKDIYQRGWEELELNPGATMADVIEVYRRQAPEQRTLFPVLALSVNQQYVQLDHRLNDGDEVALLPPVSGGLDSPPTSDGKTGDGPQIAPGTSFRCEIVRERISTSFLAGLRQGEDGAVVVFEGIVRNNTRGRETLYLDYEAYEPMALTQMNALAEKALNNYEIREIVIVHRLGRIEISETSVLIAVAAAHRGAAFDACRFAIDTLKRTVPIWKKEYFVDGAVWADGEPFPEEIRARATGKGVPNSEHGGQD